MAALHIALLLVAVVLFVISAIPAVPQGTILARLGLASFAASFAVGI
jgi:hypothetical protein